MHWPIFGFQINSILNNCPRDQNQHENILLRPQAYIVILLEINLRASRSHFLDKIFVAQSVPARMLINHLNRIQRAPVPGFNHIIERNSISTCSIRFFYL